MRNLSPFRVKKTFLVVNKSIYCGEAVVWFFIGFVYPVLNPEAMERRRRARTAATKAALFFFSSFQSTTRSVIAHSIMVLYFDPKYMDFFSGSRNVVDQKNRWVYT